MRKKLVIAIALVIAISMLVSPAFAQAPYGWGNLMGYFWGCGNGPLINGYGFGSYGIPGAGLPYGLGGFAGGLPFSGCGWLGWL